MLPQDSSSSTTSRRGAPRGSRRQYKAERRLKRELTNKTLLASLGSGLLDVTKHWADGAKSSPIVATVSAIAGLGILYRVRILSEIDYIAGLSLVGLLDAANFAQAIGQAATGIIGGIGILIPSVGSKTVNIGSQESFTANSPNVSFGEERATTPVVTESAKGGYVPE